MRTTLWIGVAILVLLSAVPSHAQTPIHLWSLQSHGTTAFTQALAIDGAGNVIIGGAFSGTVNFGGGNLQSAGWQNNDFDIFVAKYNSSGVHQWSQRFGSAGMDSCLAVAVDNSGNILITGFFDTDVDFGGSTLVTAGQQDIFVAKFAPNGTHIWSQRFGGTGTDYGQGIAVDGSGNVIITGFFRNTVDFGDGGLVSAGWTPGLELGDVFLAKYDSNGVHQWSKRFGDTQDDAGNSVAVGPSGNVVVTGTFYGTVDFGGGNVTTSVHEAFISMYNPAGVHQWTARSTGVNAFSFGWGYSVDVDASENVVVAGSLWGAEDLGGGSLTDLGSGDAFVAKYNSSGAHQWSHRFGGASFDLAYGVGTDGTGNVMFTGRFTGVANFGGSNFTSPGYVDVFLAQYDANGVHRWSRTGGVTYAGWGAAIRSDALGDVVAAGATQGTANFGGCDLVEPHSSVYVAKYHVLEAPAVSHNGIWEDGEYCGRDAYVTTLFPEMNHDCVIDGLDVGLFLDQLYKTGPNLSGDFNDDNTVDVFSDYGTFAPKVGSAVAPCNGTPTPSVLQGSIALSYSSNPATIVSTTVEPPGPHSLYVVASGFRDAKYIEYAIYTTQNVFITNSTLLVPGLEGPSCNAGTFNTVVAACSELRSGPTVIARIDYDLQTTAPTTFTLAPANCQTARVRWAKASADTSFQFATITSAQSNPITSVGTVSGNTYGDVEADCAFNGPDIRYGGRIVRATPGTYTATSDVDGNYTLFLPPGAFTIKLDPVQNDSWKKSPCQVSSYSVNVAVNNAILAKDFAIKPVGAIEGTVYRHIAPTGCAFDPLFDFKVAGKMIVANPGGYTGYSGADGKYKILVPIGQYTVTLATGVNDPWISHPCQTNPSYVTNVFTNTTSGGDDFVVTLGASWGCNPSVTVGRPRAIPGTICPGTNHAAYHPCPGEQAEWPIVVAVDYWSSNPLPAGTKLSVTLDPSATVDGAPTSACALTGFSSSGFNQVTMTINEPIYPAHSCVIYVKGTLSAGTSNLTTSAVLTNVGTCTPTMLAHQRSDAANCSCDPNDLAVSPGCGPAGEVVLNKPLVYNVHFSNIGSGPAKNVFIEDILDTDLDLSTLSIVASDRTVTSWQVDPGRKLVINFTGINLSGTAGPGSPDGYVTFMVYPNDNLANGTTITNSAAITFDYNNPVITNTVLNTISSTPCPVTGVDDEPTLPMANYLGLNYPNPFNPATTIEYGLASQQHVEVAIYDVNGALVRRLVSGTRPAGWHTVNWDGRDQKGNSVASGVYLSRMVAGSFNKTRKLVLLK